LNPWWDFWTVNVQSVLPTRYVDVYTYTTTRVFASREEANANLAGTTKTTTQTQVTTNLVSDTIDGININTRTEAVMYMRAVDVRFTLTNWGSNEDLVDVKIDGRSITFGGQA
jgi:hypothetical protein